MLAHKPDQARPAANWKRAGVGAKISPRTPNRAVLSERMLAGLVRKCWCRETSYNAAQWSRSNPALGQCAVTALLVQDFFGVKLLRGQISGE